ncbi:MAG: DMT family transporter [Acidobacteria bacterium]|nr:DMT family transporter [Acidobacteriota bacterium]MCB9378538.1 DMT family transporter [Holophagales bacterium]
MSEAPTAPPANPPAPPTPASKVLLALLLVQVCFSSLQIVGKIVLAELPPLALAATRVLIATPILLAIAWRHDRFVPDRADWPRLALLGGLGIFANQVLFLLGLSFTTATSAGVLMPSIPVFTAAIAGMLGIERLTGRRLTGILLAAAGAVALVDPASLDVSSRGSIGNLLILANCLAYSIFLVGQRPLLVRIPWRTLIAWSFLTGGMATIAVAAPSLARVEWAALAPKTFAGVLWIGLVPTAFAFALNTWAVRRTSPAMVAAFITLQPLLTTAGAVAWLGERPGWDQGLGFALIAGGLALVATARRGARS